MRKSYVLFSVLLSFTAIAAACDDNSSNANMGRMEDRSEPSQKNAGEQIEADASSSPQTPNSPDASAAEPGPGEFKSDYRTSSAFFTKMSQAVKGASPHGSVRIWYSTNIKDLASQTSFSVPEGTVAIKEFDETGDGSKTGIAVMVKKEKGYDSANNDWYYEMRDANGAALPQPAPGKVAMCIGCHLKDRATDFLGGTQLN